MANLNLSEFTEKTFVADADWTFVWDTAGLISKKVSRNNWLNSGELTTSAPVTISQTWNAGSNVMTALKVVATDTASGTASKLLELWSGSTPALKSYVTKAGSFVGGVVGAANPAALAFPDSGSYSVGIYSPTSYKIQFGMTSLGPGGAPSAAYLGLQYEMTGGVLSWGLTAQDIVLARDGESDHIAMRRGALGQKFSVYGTYPGAAWERFTITAPTSGNVLLGTYKGTGGIARGLEFQADGTTRMVINAAGETFIGVGFYGLRVSVGNASGGSPVADIGGGGGLTVTGRSGGSYGWTSDSNSALHALRDTALFRNAAGVVEINNGTAGTFRDLRVRSVIQQPPASITPASNGDYVVEATNDTTLTFRLKGSDGVVRSATLTLAP